MSLASSKWYREHPAPPGAKSYSFTAQRSNDLSHERLSLVHRALVKQGLEFVWLDSGERALGDAFDRERAIVLEGGHHGYLATLRKVSFSEGELHHGMEYAERLRESDRHPLLFLVAWFWGVPLVTDTLFPEPTETPPDECLLWTF